MVDRTIIATLEQMRSFDYTAGNHDTLLGIGNLAQDVLSGLGLTATSQTVVSGLVATQTSTPSMTINIGAGRIYTMAAADPTSVSAIPIDVTTVCQQGAALAQTVTLTAPSAGQSQWNLIQCQYQQGDAVRINDPTGGVVPFYNSSNPTVPTPTSINTVRQARCVLSVLTGTSAATGSEVPPTPSSGWAPLYLVNVVGGQTQITNAQILVASPSIGTGVPSNYPNAPFLSGFLKSHHGGIAGQAPKINLATETTGVLGYAQMSPVRKLLGSALNLYVNVSTGNDSNPGTDPSHPFQTIQAAVNAVYRNYDFNGNGCTINVANGTYNVSPGANGYGISCNGVPVGLNSSILIVGNVSSPGSVTLAISNGNGVLAGYGASLDVSGMTVTATGTNQGLVGALGYGFVSINGAFMHLSSVVVGSCGTSQLWAATGGIITTQPGNFTLTGTAATACAAGFGGTLWLNASTVTVTGLTVTTSFAWVSQTGNIEALGLTFVGTATGPRYLAALNGTILTNGGGANYFPGNSAGSTSSGGQYV